MSDPEPDVAAIARALDHAVAEAADAWLNEPRDHEAYRRLVAAVLTRRANGAPMLPGLGVEQPEIADAVADDTPSVALAELIDARDPRATLDQLRRPPA